jgi:tripeptide aminopeptidase
VSSGGWRTAPTVSIAVVAALCVLRGAQDRAVDVGPLLLKDAPVAAALAAVRKTEPWVLEEQVRLCEIPAPPFKEAERGKAYAQAFRELGLKNVRIDKIGNVLGERPGAAARPHVVFSAHLDTVFPEETDVRVTRLGSVLKGPGIGDDCRGLAVVLGVIKAMADANVQTEGTITFVGTVGEEGLGDLRGVKQLFEGELKGKIDRFVSIDGTGLGITHIGVGSRRYRVAFKGPGGHSYGAFGLANPVHALGRAIAKIGDFRVPTEPKTTFNVGRVGGGTSVNSIAFEAWAEVDLRSADTASLQSVDANFHKAVDTALEEENLRWANRGKLAVEKTLAGDRPAGRTPANSAIVQSAVSVTTALGLQATLDEGSTDANIPMSLNIPAVTIDGGGRGTGAHSLGETFDSTNSEQGTSRALLLAIALTRR